MDLSWPVCDQCSAISKVQLSITKQINISLAQSGAAPTREIASLSKCLLWFNSLLQIMWNLYLCHFLTREPFPHLLKHRCSHLPNQTEQGVSLVIDGQCHVSRLHPQLPHPRAGKSREQSGTADTSHVGIRTRECGRSVLHQLLLMTMLIEQMEAWAAWGKAGAKQPIRSVSPQSGLLSLNAGNTSGWSINQPCPLA